ncbi:hypothetical protein VOI54_16835 [Tamlana sp. 2201CG12-4]|uniref:hypothetical protein n=1 Tax=Tamlana sp. 2201CG12-4 TaxID=3112582 RepID=UPI002DB7BBF5|nr:hypothetical protein [Tamlana sp. 2201CG12-4]MEC3908696.1 hypothetical protein [Tamlana sp. 2201CG12-4]
MKPKKPRNILKIIAGVIIFLTLPSILFFGFLYFKYNEELPVGIQGYEADALAKKMLVALDYEAYKNTNHIEWTFKKRRHYNWNKAKNICEVYWKDYKVILDLNDYSQSRVYIHGFKNESDMTDDLIEKAIKYYNKDSFWLVAPYKIFDEGTLRQIVKTEHNKNALLVTYTPDDSYLWLLDDNNKPIAFKMWTSLLPIDGLEASWNNWTVTESGAQLPTFHKFMFFGLEISDIKGIE